MVDTGPRLTTSIAGVELATPLIAAAGTCGYVDELLDVCDPAALGAVTTKSITQEARAGNDPWRMADLPVGMLNAVGLANKGLDAFLSEELPRAAGIVPVVIGSIAGHCVQEYLTVAAAFDQAIDLPLVELNVSCPNTATGLQFGRSPELLGELLREIRPVLASTKMIVKLSPDAESVPAMAAAACEAGADGLTVANTLPGMAIDVHSRRPRLSNRIGGLSGPAVHPLAVRLIDEVYREVAADAGVPIIGVGGVMTWEDAAEFILAGASAVGMGTALFVDPRRPVAVLKGLGKWVERQGVESITDLVGQVE
jgi:dihydroorotate dehydrogenase (NAD+) catalytic subunit